MISQNIIQIARSYVGMQEIQNNAGFKDEKFQQLMESVGWRKLESWCAYFVELVWKQAYEGSDFVHKLDVLFNAGAVATYNNFLHDGTFQVDKHCSPGAIVIWQYWEENKPTWQGHAGIVVSDICSHEFDTIEGNTNAKGGREGIEVAVKQRLLNFDAKNGLVLKGFIHPREIDVKIEEPQNKTA